MEMNAQATRIEVDPYSPSRERVAKLLTRYPKVSARENREILEFMRNGRHLEIGLLTSDERLRPNLDAFMRDHKKYFQLTFREAAVIVAVIAAFLLAAWLLWEPVGPGPF
jgi:hypothetical protein